MSAPKSNMPSGTRQAALVAACLAACLLAWRGTTLLSAPQTIPEATASASGLQDLHALIEPVLGRQAMRLATHEKEDGARSILILVDAPGSQFHISNEKTARIETILTAATGFDPSRDTLQIQAFAFAPGTAGGVSIAQLLELGALVILTGLLGFIALAPGQTAAGAARPEPARREEASAPSPGPHLRAVPLEATGPAQAEADDEAVQLARGNPKRTASIVKAWLNDGSAS